LKRQPGFLEQTDLTLSTSEGLKSEELIAVGIIDHQEPVAPRTLLDWSE
jgi:hypothetical protein